jgi:Cu/Ag efflux protein CusF
MRNTSKIARVSVAFALAVGVAVAPRLSHADQGTPETAAAEVVTASAIIQKIDRNGRMVTLRGEKGAVLDVKVGPNVNLDKVKPGDRVNAAYYEEVAVSLSKPGQAPKMVQTVTEHGGVTAEQTTVTAKVVAVNPDQNTVTVKNPEGVTHQLKVQDPDLQAQLGKIKPGDSLNVTYTQAIAISLEPIK